MKRMPTTSTPKTSHKVRYMSDVDFCWQRKKQGKSFQFLDEHGKPIKDAAELERITKLVIPPAWTDVKICQKANGHIQAVGFDARGRKQYIYHPDWTSQQQQHKFDKMVEFGALLPDLRQKINSDMRQRNLSRERVVATVVWLLDHTFIRVGNQAYARDNKSYGLTTLREKHVEVDHNTVTLSFKGKSNIYHEVDVRDARVAKTIKMCLELPGYELFQYLDEAGERQVVDSSDVNEYLQSYTGQELSAKDFRTWGGTSLAAQSLYAAGNADSQTALKHAITAAVKDVSSHLRNTPTVCRKYYIHPVVVQTYEKAELIPYFDRYYRKEERSNGDLAGTSQFFSLEELATWNLLKSRAN